MTVGPVNGDVNLNGGLTLGENIADLGGAARRLSRAAEVAGGQAAPEPSTASRPSSASSSASPGLGQNMTAEAARRCAQTDPHAPGPFRVNGTVSNMPEFQRRSTARRAADGAGERLPGVVSVTHVSATRRAMPLAVALAVLSAGQALTQPPSPAPNHTQVVLLGTGTRPPTPTARDRPQPSSSTTRRTWWTSAPASYGVRSRRPWTGESPRWIRSSCGWPS